MDPVLKDSLVTARTSHGLEVRAVPLQLSRHRLVFEIHGRDLALRASEVLSELQITVRERMLYSGRAVVKNLVDTGLALVCEATLDDGWLDVDGTLSQDPTSLKRRFLGLLQQWQKVYRVLPEYKVVIADLQTFLTDLRLWLEQLELGIRAASPAERLEVENEMASGLRPQVTAALSDMFARYEAVCDRIDEDLVPAHQAFGQRQLHPYLLCGPFIHRSYVKPLGYAGDYEMMNMIVRNSLEGDSLYAKLVDAFLLDQVGPQAVRNRVDFLYDKIVDETSRVARLGRSANIYCIACGPAWEVRNFVARSPLADQAQFQLMDFNEETLQHAGNRLEEARRKHNRKTSFKLVKDAAQNILKGRTRGASAKSGYDLVYCSGLYDYLNDRAIKELNTCLYDLLRPGGLLVVGNFAPNTPVRNFIEHFLEWFLIYRDSKQLAVLGPKQASPVDCKVMAEATGTNIFLEVRKPQ